ncbi:MAG: hypothetical protein H7062_00970 [Candidatus Saccharimonas sp.]|nr:hypothetical protein [Planctomycetaceae bacterium]
MATFLLGALLIDRGLGWLFQSASTQVVHGETMKHVNVAPAYMRDGIVVFGSSRAAHHVDPQVLSDQTGLTAYNAGSNGQSISFHRALQELLLQQPERPRLFVLQLDALDINRPLPAVRSLVLAPFMDRSTEARKLVLQSDPRAWIKQLSLTWRFNSLIHQFSGGMRSTPEDGNQFHPLSGVMDERRVAEATRRISQQSIQPRPVEETTASLEMHRDFIRRARENNIDVVLLVGPRLLRRSDWEGDAVLLLQQMAAEEHVPLLQFDEDKYPVFRDPAVYCDKDHLNGRGATLLTGLLSDHIREFSSSRGQHSAHLNQANRPEDPLR